MTRSATTARAGWAGLYVGVPLAVGVAMLVLALGGGGCEAIVPGSVGAYRCASTAASACPPGQVCNTSAEQCVPVCSMTSCVAPLVCDPVSQQCVDSSMMMPPDAAMPAVDSGHPPPIDSGGPVDTGAPQVDSRPPVDVTTDSGCGVGCPCPTASVCKGTTFCADNTVLPGIADTAFCTTACCSSADCPDGSVCYASGTPGNYCVPTQVLAIAATGASTGGATCASNADCRSGTCDTGGHCLDTCCSDASCTPGAFCALDETTPGSLHQGFYCLAESPPGAPAGSMCTLFSDCSSNACVIASGTCTTTCCGAASCTAGVGTSCGVSKTSPTSSDSVTFCGTGGGMGAFDAGCSQDDKCASQVCDNAAGKCTDFCCVDQDCASFGTYVCRPRVAAPHYLICVRGS